MHSYRVNKSMRKSISLKIRNGEVIINAPFFMTSRMIDSFVAKHSDWITHKLENTRKSLIDISKISEYKQQAREYIPQRVKQIANKFGLEYNTIKITSAKTRWGSCTSKKNLNFTYRLMLTPKEVIDYVIVHELSHTIHMNHSPRFRAQVKSMMPDYKNHELYLKKNADLFSVS